MSDELWSSHAITRARERYDLTIYSVEIRMMEAWIWDQDPRAVFLGASGGTSSIYAIRFALQWLAAVYRDNHIITFLPVSELGAHRRMLNIHKRRHGFKQAERHLPLNRNRSILPKVI